MTLIKKKKVRFWCCRVSLVAWMFLGIYFYNNTRPHDNSLRRRVMIRMHMFMQERNNMPMFHFIVSWLVFRYDQLDTIIGYIVWSVSHDNGLYNNQRAAFQPAIYRQLIVYFYFNVGHLRFPSLPTTFPRSIFF